MTSSKSSVFCAEHTPLHIRKKAVAMMSLFSFIIVIALFMIQQRTECFLKRQSKRIENKIKREHFKRVENSLKHSFLLIKNN